MALNLPTFAATATILIEFSPTSIKCKRLSLHGDQHCPNTSTSGSIGSVVFLGVHAVFAAAYFRVAKRIVVKAFAVELETVCLFAFAWSFRDPDFSEEIRSAQWLSIQKVFQLLLSSLFRVGHGQDSRLQAFDVISRWSVGGLTGTKNRRK